MKNIIGLSFLMSTLWVSASSAQQLTAEFCRKACDSNEYAGWCIPLGTGARKFVAPLNAILAAATAGSADFKLENCNRQIVVNGSDISITGAPCSLTNIGTDLEVTSELSGVIKGTIANAGGFVEIKLVGSDLKSGFKTSP